MLKIEQLNTAYGKIRVVNRKQYASVACLQKRLPHCQSLGLLRQSKYWKHVKEIAPPRGIN